MKLIRPPVLSDPDTCPYLENRETTQEYFFAYDLAPDEFEFVLSTGWRKFGMFFFRPNCSTCQECRPLRVLNADFKPSKSQRKILKKNSDIEFKVTPLVYRKEIYDLYVAHSRVRFEKEASKIESEEIFKETHFEKSTKSYMSEYYLDKKMIACGFLDESSKGLSSVYFIYNPDFSDRSLGHLGALLEIQYAKDNNLEYYYLGYYIRQNNFMNYKAKFKPHELLDWKTMTWHRV